MLLFLLLELIIRSREIEVSRNESRGVEAGCVRLKDKASNAIKGPPRHHIDIPGNDFTVHGVVQ